MPKFQYCKFIYYVQTINNTEELVDPYWLYSSCDIMASFCKVGVVFW